MLSQVSWFSRIIWGALLLGILFLIIPPLLSNIGILSFRTAFLGLAVGGGLAVLAAILALVRMIPSLRDHGRLNTLVAMLLGLGIVIYLGLMFSNARSAPPIHDITTDLDSPPQFTTIAPRDYSKERPFTAQQRRALHEVGYRDLEPLVVSKPVAEVTQAAADVLENMGLEIAAVDTQSGRVEATDTTFWFGFKDDVVIRVTSTETGRSLVDVRSVSRVGLSDVGTNAKRIKAILAALGEQLS